MPKVKVDALDELRTLAELGETILGIVRETGLLKPKRRKARVVKKKAKPKAPKGLSTAASPKSKAPKAAPKAQAQAQAQAVEREEL